MTRPSRAARPLEVRRVVLPPGQVDHGRDALAVAEQHGVARAVAVLALVELDEVGARLLALADEHRDRSTVSGTSSTRRRGAGSLARG